MSGSDFKIVCFVQIYNELKKGNLERFVTHVTKHVDEIVVYDDGSTDGSYEYMQKVTPHIIRGTKNSFNREKFNKQELLELALTLNPDFILWLDVDEVLSTDTQLQKLCQYAVNRDLDGIMMREINLWRSSTWHRVDSLYDMGWYVRLWRVRPGIKFECEEGLHLDQFPSTIRLNKVKKVKSASVIHYGFSSMKQLAYKWFIYSKFQEPSYMLYRLLLETYDEDIQKEVLDKDPKYLELVNSLNITYERELVRIDHKKIPTELWINSEKQPPKLTFQEMLEEIEQYKEEVFG